MRNGLSCMISLCLLLGATARAFAAEWKLKDGTVIVGEPSSLSRQGVVFKLDPPPPGKSPFSGRVAWTNLTENALRELAKARPDAAPFVRLLLPPSPEEIQQQIEVAIPEARKPEIVIGEIPSPGRPHAGASVIGSLFSGGGLVLLLILYATNLYAAFEIAQFRNYPWPLVTGIAVAAPFLTPVVFLCLPRRREVVAEEGTVEEEQVEEAEPEPELAVEAEPAQPVAVATPPIPPTKYFKRGEFNINRRFIETKFASFFRAIPSEEERDLNLVIKSARGEFTGRRILKITNTELTFQVPKAEGATVDEVIPLNDILEIQIRHKDATD